MSSAIPHRFDPPTTATPSVGGPHVVGPKKTAGSNAPLQPHAQPPMQRQGERPAGHATPEDGPTESDRGESDHPSRSSGGLDLATPEDWLPLHATELVDRIQAWASDLDDREAQLNARSSLQDLRERKFRLHQQDVAIELAEQKRSIDRLRREIEAQARRLAFGEDSLRQ